MVKTEFHKFSNEDTTVRCTYEPYVTLPSQSRTTVPVVHVSAMYQLCAMADPLSATPLFHNFKVGLSCQLKQLLKTGVLRPFVLQV